MRFGLIFPQFDIGAGPDGVKSYAQLAERLGYKHLTSFDQPLGLDQHSRPNWSYVHTADDLFHELMVLFGFLAGVTEKIEFTTGVIVAPMRGTALLAKQATEVNILSNGRFRLGLGAGIRPEEFEGCGFEYGNRGKRFDEQIDYLRKLWRDEIISYDGKYHKLDRGGLNPLPIGRNIPIWIGGISKPAIRRTAQLGDGWLPNFAPDDYGRQCIEELWRKAEEYDRDPTQIGIEGCVPVLDKPDEEIEENIEKWRSIGASHISLTTIPEEWVESERRWHRLKEADKGIGGIQPHIDIIEKFSETFPQYLKENV